MVRAILIALALGGLVATGAMVRATPQPASSVVSWIPSTQKFGPLVCLQHESTIVVGVVSEVDPGRSDGRAPIVDIDIQQTLRGQEPLHPSIRVEWKSPFPSLMRCGAGRDVECGATRLPDWSLPAKGTRVIVGLDRYGPRYRAAPYPRLGWNEQSEAQVRREIDELAQQEAMVDRDQPRQSMAGLAKHADAIVIVRLKEQLMGISSVVEVIEALHGRSVTELSGLQLEPKVRTPSDGKYILFIGAGDSVDVASATAENVAHVLDFLGQQNLSKTR